MVAVNLARLARAPLRIALIDRSGEFACGAAYATTRDEHVLNVPACAMGAFPDAPYDFVRWLGEAGRTTLDDHAYLPRSLYGSYLKSLLRAAERGAHHIRRLSLDVTGIRRGPGRHTTLLKHGDQVACVARDVVLALGSLAPSAPAGFDATRIQHDPRYVEDSSAFVQAPWFDPAGGDTLVIGTGLTALDVILSFYEAAAPGRLIVLSRHGRFPLPHAYDELEPSDPFGQRPLPVTAAAAMARIREAVSEAHEAGRDWRSVIDAVPPRAAEVWNGFSPPERRRFLRHVKTHWEVHRHRAPKASLDAKDALIASGQLIVSAARLLDAQPIPGALEVRYVERGTPSVTTVRVATLINCTSRTTGYPFTGVASDPLGMGLHARADGALLDAQGNVLERVNAIGWPLRGALYESTAVRELRAQARALAEKLAADHDADQPLRARREIRS
jgi:uncharacterized NAD(P)/FAD-binding protein YdhS